MPSSIDFSGRPFHFLGIGGIGMSALAYILAKRKLPVYGSDIRSSHITQRLQELGAHIFWRQDASNLEFFKPANDKSNEVNISGDSSQELRTSQQQEDKEPQLANRRHQLPQVICSTAIQPNNSEYRAALDMGCPIFHRSDVLAALLEDYQSIAVAGTHGKTTTSSLIGYLLLQAGLDPTIVVGGEVKAWEGNARQGNGPYLVAEADESDGSLAKLSAYIGVVTNIELDHPDHYQSLEQVVRVFQIFAQRCKILVGSIDCPTVKKQLKPTISYSLNKENNADYTVDCIAYRGDGTTARVWERGEILGQLNLKLLGQHNLSNALAAVAVGRLLGLDFSTIATALATFEGARRRFEYKGEANGIVFVDDYAHHPSEIRATLAAARLQSNTAGSSPRKRIVAIFQPHRYSRTLKFLDDFARSFSDADVVVVSDIYSAGEPDLSQVSGQQVADSIAANHNRVYYKPTLKSISAFLSEILQPGDLALFLGAGNLNQVIPEVLSFHQTVERDMATEIRYLA
ncbi:MAG: UDP-N-acetylmuramate--L-alanine ligase [Oscillatoriaceae bacterium SKW80]|nr:UDP-N-acetylmuramate--L-alanine ligase [Oscillatoriaceae bacterium SKYG93]MCX8121593.1 UDP-N-acetylmuramate--L-alanine ligase [Oscillatoriaceae bacterium SKW80]MDW8452820.1 UDP-N-acetylmuramate--L-alanine ligase [Oscillatoriaceae cyanobacterium SKYGB_i_bin93]HIK27938.1 UDP-N-acetylmuramate--L-alanine ligase [Oscillatoriaceae cyanobacterium M7585_C2015_266]